MKLINHLKKRSKTHSTVKPNILGVRNDGVRGRQRGVLGPRWPAGPTSSLAALGPWMGDGVGRGRRRAALESEGRHLTVNTAAPITFKKQANGGLCHFSS